MAHVQSALCANVDVPVVVQAIHVVLHEHVVIPRGRWFIWVGPAK